MTFLHIFKHLLPNARAWRVTVDKRLRQFFTGLSGAGGDIKTAFDDIWLDIFPETTRELGAWESQFGIPDTGVTEQQRRDRIDAAWKALGGQDPRYIQNTLRANGFDVHVHEWWEPGTAAPPGVKGCATPRNPLLHLRPEYTQVFLRVECGEALAECGEALAECGNGPDPRGYPLVNKTPESAPAVGAGCGEAFMGCGEARAECGQFTRYEQVPKNYIVPTDPNKWPYFLYLGGEVFGTLAQVPPSRRDEFEALALKICPTHLWLGVLVEYN